MNSPIHEFRPKSRSIGFSNSSDWFKKKNLNRKPCVLPSKTWVFSHLLFISLSEKITSRSLAHLHMVHGKKLKLLIGWAATDLRTWDSAHFCPCQLGVELAKMWFWPKELGFESTIWWFRHLGSDKIGRNGKNRPNSKWCIPLKNKPRSRLTSRVTPPNNNYTPKYDWVQKTVSSDTVFSHGSKYTVDDKLDAESLEGNMPFLF